MTLTLDRIPRVVHVSTDHRRLMAELDDGRTLLVPLEWFPRLAHGTPEERAHYELNSDGTGIHWPELDEDISLEGLLAGRRSREGAGSLRRWMEARTNRGERG